MAVEVAISEFDVVDRRQVTFRADASDVVVAQASALVSAFAVTLELDPHPIVVYTRGDDLPMSERSQNTARRELRPCEGRGWRMVGPSVQMTGGRGCLWMRA
jgi:hypothetical protein